MQPLIPYTEPVVIPLPGALPDIHGFGIMVALGLWLGSTMAARKAERDGLEPDMISQIVGWLVVGIFVGGHWGHALFYEPREYFADPIRFLKFWDGLSSFGGFIACTLLVIWFIRSKNKQVRKLNAARKKEGLPLKPLHPIKGYGDALLYGTSLGWMLGRFGCFLAHDHPGVVTNFWLGVHGICPGGSEVLACHDLGLYESIWGGIMCLIFIQLDKKPRHPGFFMGVYVLAYAPVRFMLDFLRAADVDQNARVLGLTPAQYGSMALVALGVWLLWSGRGQTPYRVLNEERRKAEEEAMADKKDGAEPAPA